MSLVYLGKNVQSINAKIDELKMFVEHLKTFDFQFSAICIPESPLSEGDDISQYNRRAINAYHRVKVA